MKLQQEFGKRLLELLEKQNISQGEFAEHIGCSRQSINFYILGKRSPDIVLATKMAEYLGVSCDYLIGTNDYQVCEDANLSVTDAGLSPDTAKFFAGLKLMTDSLFNEDKEKFEALGIDYEKEVIPYRTKQATLSLDLLNKLISHDKFGVLLRYIEKYRDIHHDEDELLILKEFMLDLKSPDTAIRYGDKNENREMVEEFCLHVISKYFDDIVRDIAK